MVKDRRAEIISYLFCKMKAFSGHGSRALAAVFVLMALLLCLEAGPAVAQMASSGGAASGSSAEADDLLESQRAKNAVLAAEANRLRAGLSDDPCNAHKYLGRPLDSNVLPGPDGAEGRTLGEVMEQATVMVFVLLKDGMAMGTGFFIGPDIVLTNRHVVDHPNPTYLVTNKALGQLTKAELVAVSEGESRDYAVLRLAGGAQASYVLPFSTEVKRTDKVGAWGFPGSVSQYDPQFRALIEKGDLSSVPEVIYSEGVVSVIMDYDPPAIMHTAMISQGNSGGPLVNEQGQVLGINTMISLDRESYRQMGISLASSDIIKFLQANGITPLMAAGPGR